MVRKITKTKVVSQFVNDYAKRYYLRELAVLLKKPHQTIKPYVEELVKEGILAKNQRKGIIEFNLNFKNKNVYDYIVISEKENLMEKLEEEGILKMLHEKLSPYFADNTFVIFGSAVNKIEKNSDIDLLMIGKADINKVIKEFLEVYNKRLHKIQITDLNKLTPALIKEIYKKHLILNNTEQIVRFFGGQYEQNKLG
jgi:predicted nucleotidyltransferase